MPVAWWTSTPHGADFRCSPCTLTVDLSRAGLLRRGMDLTGVRSEVPHLCGVAILLTVRRGSPLAPLEGLRAGRGAGGASVFPVGGVPGDLLGMDDGWQSQRALCQVAAGSVIAASSKCSARTQRSKRTCHRRRITLKET